MFLTYHIHVYAVCIGPGMLKVFFQSLSQRIWDLVEANEFLDSEHLGVVAGSARIQPLDNGRNITEDTSIH